MATSRREFFTEVGGIGLGGMLLAAANLKADEEKPQAKPPSSMVFETVFTEGLAQLSYLIGDKATGQRRRHRPPPRRGGVRRTGPQAQADDHPLRWRRTSTPTSCPAAANWPTAPARRRST